MRPFAVVRGALGAEALADLRREADALAAKTPPTVANGCVLEPVVAAAGDEWRADRAAYAAARRETCVSALFDALPRLAAAHLGAPDRVFLFNDHFVVKPARSDVAFRWHRDVDEQLARRGPRRRYVSCWCPLDDVDEANGCLVVRFRGEELPLRCAAGDVVLLSDDCEHASGANGSAFPRRALYAQYSDGAVGGDRPLRLAIPVDVSREPRSGSGATCRPALDLDAAAASARTVLADVDAWRAAAAATAEREHARAVEAWDGARGVAPGRSGDGAHWRAVPVAWRRCYAVAAFYAGWSRGEQGEAGNAVACLDLGLMLSDAFHRPRSSRWWICWRRGSASTPTRRSRRRGRGRPSSTRGRGRARTSRRSSARPSRAERLLRARRRRCSRTAWPTGPR
ncbi:phytanoyl-CoA dioxygenase [Aureococcus anophagefferens]|nr:phytanoyl-CoA dioxygenase [Aureococcus anophagefferens]